MRYISTLVWTLFFVSTGLFAQKGYQISISIDGYEENTLMLAYYYGDKQYIKDTSFVNTNGQFIFSGEDPLPGGVYLAVMKPENDFFQVVVNEEEQHFQMQTSREAPTENMKVSGSKDNEIFYDYIRFLAKEREKQASINQRKEAGASEVEIQQALEALNQEVVDYQLKLIAEHPKSMTAATVKANLPADMPDFKGTEEEVNMAKWRYLQKHYFDNTDLGDPRLLRTSFLFQQIDYFVNKLQVQHPDTLILAIDQVLEKTRPAPETFKYYLIHFLNYYARSKIVGMDAVYVHLVEKYYATGQADWTDPDQLEKILDNAKTLKPLLIGKKAPNIVVQDRNGNRVSLDEIDSEYTILYFWRYDCGHCKESTPKLKEFYDKYKDKGVKIMAVCVKFTDEVPGCWDYIDENGIQDWLHTVDPYNRSKFSTVYDVKSTPQIYVLDRDKIIQFKRIGAEQLGDVIDHLILTGQEPDGKTRR